MLRGVHEARATGYPDGVETVMAIDPKTLQSIKLLADKPLVQMTLRDVLTITAFMDQDPTDEELASIGLPSKHDL